MKAPICAHAIVGGDLMDPKKAKKQMPIPETEKSDYDVLGSYTGVPKYGDMPVQDADDL